MTDVPVSEELFATVAPGVELCYQTFGDPAGDPLLLVMGLGGPMIWWDTELCEQLAEAGFHVVRYDNRDTGRSSRIEGRVTRAQPVQAFLGQSLSRSPESASKTWTLRGSVVTWRVSPFLTESRAETRTITLLGVPSTPLVP